VLAALFHSLLAVETAAEEGRKVVLIMLATGGIFVGVIALGELSHWAAKQRRRRQDQR
jgi:heme/copper-type cytochrome/quinol oxidase subunit 2